MNLNIEVIQNESTAEPQHNQEETKSKEGKICPDVSTLEEAELVFIPALKYSKKVAVLTVTKLMDYIKKAFKCLV